MTNLLTTAAAAPTDLAAAAATIAALPAVKLTPKQAAMMAAIAASEYGDGPGSQIWTCAVIYSASDKGTFGTLVKRGLVASYPGTDGDDGTCEMTDAGILAWANRHPEAALKFARNGGGRVYAVLGIETEEFEAARIEAAAVARAEWSARTLQQALAAAAIAPESVGINPGYRPRMIQDIRTADSAAWDAGRALAKGEIDEARAADIRKVAAAQIECHNLMIAAIDRATLAALADREAEADRRGEAFLGSPVGTSGYTVREVLDGAGSIPMGMAAIPADFEPRPPLSWAEQFDEAVAEIDAVGARNRAAAVAAVAPIAGGSPEADEDGDDTDPDDTDPLGPDPYDGRPPARSDYPTAEAHLAALNAYRGDDWAGLTGQAEQLAPAAPFDLMRTAAEAVEARRKARAADALAREDEAARQAALEAQAAAWDAEQALEATVAEHDARAALEAGRAARPPGDRPGGRVGRLASAALAPLGDALARFEAEIIAEAAALGITAEELEAREAGPTPPPISGGAPDDAELAARLAVLLAATIEAHACAVARLDRLQSVGGGLRWEDADDRRAAEFAAIRSTRAYAATLGIDPDPHAGTATRALPTRKVDTWGWDDIGKAAVAAAWDAGHHHDFYDRSDLDQILDCESRIRRKLADLAAAATDDDRRSIQSEISRIRAGAEAAGLDLDL